MAIAIFLDLMCLVLRASGLWLCYSTLIKFCHLATLPQSVVSMKNVSLARTLPRPSRLFSASSTFSRGASCGGGGGVSVKAAKSERLKFRRNLKNSKSCRTSLNSSAKFSDQVTSCHLKPSPGKHTEFNMEAEFHSIWLLEKNCQYRVTTDHDLFSSGTHFMLAPTKF